jgi:(E)-4-hydroxy-3-methylbut-2-enyl-diphosphate synthase
MTYCPDLFRYQRRKTDPVRIGHTLLGGIEPIRIQSMTNTSTMDTEASVAQCKRIWDAGADYVRLTAQGVREAENLALIRAALTKDGYEAPLIADIHFNPKAADAAARNVEKVRINPGNYVDSVKTFAHFVYTDAEYAQELQKIRDRFVPFLTICRAHGTALRIGVNHGSLSDRIMSRYGDTPAGMVESCMEFLRICVEESFSDVVLSIKASNVLVMVQTVRLLVDRMNAEGMAFPLHLGVTEAGDGEDGRVKSAVGIGALLMDGIGDTIRVSLSEDPEREIPVAMQLVRLVRERVQPEPAPWTVSVPWSEAFCETAFPGVDPYRFHRRETVAVGPFGGGQFPQVLLDLSAGETDFTAHPLKPDFVYVGSRVQARRDGGLQICDASAYCGQPDVFPMYTASSFFSEEVLLQRPTSMTFLQLTLADVTAERLKALNELRNVVLVVTPEQANVVAEIRAVFHRLLHAACRLPVVVWLESSASDKEEEQLAAGIDFGSLLLDGFADGVMYGATENCGTQPSDRVSVLFSVLQSTRMRITRTEYISCPSCGRTLFDLQQVVASIKARTSHLKGLKIGIMGCIVNGPGEMADADYGYVGAGRGEVSLYKGQTCVEKNIPTDRALDKLIALIRSHGDWVDP